MYLSDDVAQIQFDQMRIGWRRVEDDLLPENWSI